MARTEAGRPTVTAVADPNQTRELTRTRDGFRDSTTETANVRAQRSQVPPQPIYGSLRPAHYTGPRNRHEAFYDVLAWGLFVIVLLGCMVAVWALAVLFMTVFSS